MSIIRPAKWLFTPTKSLLMLAKWLITSAKSLLITKMTFGKDG